MPSKSKDVRIEQRRILDTKLDLRIQKLAQRGISKENAQRDPLVKNLKAKIRETNIRIKASDKLVLRTQELVQTKAQKLAEPAKKKETPEPVAKSVPGSVEPKPKKRAAGAKDGESKKQPAVPADKEPKKRTPKKKEEPEKPKEE